MGTRRKSRELALQMLFQADMGKQDASQVRKSFWKERADVEEDVRGFADDIFRYAQERASDVDTMIEKHAPNWRLERMAAVDRNVLRLGVAEMMAYDTPTPIIINEALEIGRKYSSPEAVNFLNGVLDSVAGELRRTPRAK
jgi:N utilization substance protein B